MTTLEKTGSVSYVLQLDKDLAESEKYNVLKKYWGYSEFREGQVEVIDHILQGHSTLAVLATGTGKSICYQIPGLMLDGLTLVISPLIALMKDQISGLKKRGIKAEGLFSGQYYKDQDRILDNAAYGDIRFLFVSPERLKSPLLLDRVHKLNISLLVVDEAHCISEWGHDFRPAYREISAFKELIKQAPILCLTATATHKVQEDILENLNILNAKKILHSPIRKNISYTVFKTENKQELIVGLLKKVRQGCAIIYVNSRRLTKELERYLKPHALKAEAFHGGMNMKEREKVIEHWEKGMTQIIVATKAFGMGIDKSDVRLVVHYEMPDSLEAYVQEAGRAGRDQKDAQAILLYNESDLLKARSKKADVFPDVEFIKNVYKTLGIHYKIASGDVKDQRFPYNHVAFCEAHNLPKFQTLNALKLLQKSDVLSLSNNISNPSKLFFDEDGIKQLLTSKKVSPTMQKFVKLLLRNYEGLYLNATTIDEQSIAKKFGVPVSKVVEGLKWISGRKIAQYTAKSEGDLIAIKGYRYQENSNIVDVKMYDKLVVRYVNAIQQVFDYIACLDCRQGFISQYFGFSYNSKCHVCDNCRESTTNNDLRKSLLELIKLDINKLSMIFSHFTLKDRAHITALLQLLESERVIKINGDKVLLI